VRVTVSHKPPEQGLSHPVHPTYVMSHSPASTGSVSCNLICPPNDLVLEIEFPASATVADAIRQALRHFRGEGKKWAFCHDENRVEMNCLLTSLDEPRDLWVWELYPMEIRRRRSGKLLKRDFVSSLSVADVESELSGEFPERFAFVGR
jgi:hypothetical protein